jgi:hypothetical protein
MNIDIKSKCDDIKKKEYQLILRNIQIVEIHSNNLSLLALLSYCGYEWDGTPFVYKMSSPEELHLSANVVSTNGEIQYWLKITGDKTSIKRSVSHLFGVLDTQIGLDDYIVVYLYDGERDIYVSRDHYRWLIS